MIRKAYVYILHYKKKPNSVRNQQAIHYTGWTYDLEARIAKHRAGTSGSKFTKGMRTRGIPFIVSRVYECEDKGLALQLEYAIKHGKVINAAGVRCTVKNLCGECTPPMPRFQAPI